MSFKNRNFDWNFIFLVHQEINYLKDLSAFEVRKESTIRVLLKKIQ